jgi:hypothetical protein
LRESNSSFYREWVTSIDCSVDSLEARIKHGWKQVPDVSPFKRKEVALVRFPPDDLNQEGPKLVFIHWQSVGETGRVVKHKHIEDDFGSEIRLQAYFAGTSQVHNLKDGGAEILYARTGLEYNKATIQTRQTAVVPASIIRFMDMWELAFELDSSDAHASALAQATDGGVKNLRPAECQICKRKDGVISEEA